MFLPGGRRRERESLHAWGGGVGGKKAAGPLPLGVPGLAAAPTPRLSPRGFFSFSRTVSTPHPGECQGLPQNVPFLLFLLLFLAGLRAEGLGATPARVWQPGTPPRGSGKPENGGCFSAQTLSGLKTSERLAAGIGTVFYTLFSALVSSRWHWLFIVFSYIYIYI